MKYVFTYNAVDVQGESQAIRRAVIEFFANNGVRRNQIRQCLETTFIFDSGKNIQEWETLVESQLRTPEGVLFKGFYVLARVFYNRDRVFEHIARCNGSLQSFVDEVYDEIT